MSEPNATSGSPAEWLDDGPSRAPEGLLRATLHQTRRTRQRPAYIAVALGAPSIGLEPSESSLRERRLTWLVMAVILALLAAGAALIAGRDRHPVVIAPPSPRESLAATPAATVTASDRCPDVTSGGPRSCETPATLPSYENADLGFAVTPDPSDPWTAVARRWNGLPADGMLEDAVEFSFGPCSAAQCGPYVSVSVSSPTYGVIVGWTTDCGELSIFDCALFQDHGGGPVRVRGLGLEELVADWEAQFGAADRQDMFVGGHPAVVLRSGSRISALVVRGGAAMSVSVPHADGLTAAQEDARLRSFVQGLRFSFPAPQVFDRAGFGVYVSALESGPWTRLHDGWGYARGDGSTVAFWFGECIDNLCNEPSVSLDLSTPADGAIVARDETKGFLRVNGAAIPELRASWRALFGPSTFSETTLGEAPAVVAFDGEAHMSILTIHDGQVVALTVAPGFAAPFEEQRLRSVLEAFAGSIYFRP